ncbi:hypothetical protein [Cytophaga aurantiaca]|uniref:hypothetical protein n=1 Tax=Cytophaga aurantiaca TaxID=29530 RepID=UPI0012F71518|nr:hypothetical protein [Cytophaga aurantiaca]
MYVYIFTNEEVPLFAIIMMFIVGIFIGFMLLGSDSIIEIDLDSGEILERLPVSLTKFLYDKNEIIGYNMISQMYIPKHPFNYTYIHIELYFHTTDNKTHSISSLTTVNFEEMLTYFFNTYPMVSDKKYKPYSEEKKEELYKSVLNQIQEDKRTFWKQKKKDLFISGIIMAAIGLMYFLLYNCSGE